MNAIVQQETAAPVDMLTPPPARPLTVIDHAIRAGATPAELERLLDLQVRADNHQLELMREKRRMDEEDRKRAAKQAFDEAMTRFRALNIVVPKTKEVIQTARGGGPGPRFMQSEFDVICRLISPGLAECGFSFRHDMRFGSRKWTTDGVENDAPWVYVTCFLVHKDGHTERLDLEGPPDSSGAKNPLQEMQSAASYLKRQSLLALTGTATGGEDDEGAMQRRRGQQQQQQAEDLQPLQEAGQAKAMEGLKALTAWWGSLTAKQRSDLSPDFKGWRQCAALADQKGVRA